jgi:hypothetical protein
VIKKADGLGRAASIALRLRRIPVKNPTGSLHGTICGSGGSRSRGPCPTNTPPLPPHYTAIHPLILTCNPSPQPISAALIQSRSCTVVKRAKSVPKLNGVSRAIRPRSIFFFVRFMRCTSTISQPAGSGSGKASYLRMCSCTYNSIIQRPRLNTLFQLRRPWRSIRPISIKVARI